MIGCSSLLDSDGSRSWGVLRSKTLLQLAPKKSRPQSLHSCGTADAAPTASYAAVYPLTKVARHRARNAGARTAASFPSFGEPRQRYSGGWLLCREPLQWQLRAKMLYQF